ncbi:MAG TPA: response regulator [Chitinophagaceae bacterium]|jgi:two-component system, OmpR family, response regulator|nr:response regulator [Chitinophagaceae bacterium]
MRERVQSKVLIVDDEPDICFLFDRILHKRNLITGYAYNLAEAARSMDADRPSLVFLDNNLPDGQGIDFIPYLKHHFPGTQVVMVTANDSPSDKKKAFGMGADDFLSKPLSLDTINRTLDKIWDQGRSV